MTPGWLLHTSAARDLIVGRGAIRTRLLEQTDPRLGISALTKAQLQASVTQLPADRQSAMTTLLDEFFRWVEILPWDAQAAACYAQLGAAGHLPEIDRMLAAHAIALGLPLLSADRRFDELDGLVRVDWTV